MALMFPSMWNHLLFPAMSSRDKQELCFFGEGENYTILQLFIYFFYNYLADIILSIWGCEPWRGGCRASWCCCELKKIIIICLFLCKMKIMMVVVKKEILIGYKCVESKGDCPRLATSQSQSRLFPVRIASLYSRGFICSMFIQSI